MKLAKKTSLAVTGFFVAAIFLIPYVRMLLTALTPANEVYEIPANYLPTSFDFSNFLRSGTRGQSRSTSSIP